jgi:hypothetical protein
MRGAGSIALTLPRFLVIVNRFRKNAPLRVLCEGA